MTDINKVTGMEAIMMRNSAHTIFFSKSGKENDSVLNRVKSGGLKKGISCYFLYLDDQEQAVAALDQ